MEQYIGLIPLGFAVGTLGTLIGAGGGFILAPVLLLVYPDKSPETITSISLAVVFFNAFSGSLAYRKMKRIDYKSGWLFAIATVPGAILGAYTTTIIPRQLFNGIFGILLVLTALFLILHPEKKNKNENDTDSFLIARRIMDANGQIYTYKYNPWLGFLLSIGVGYLSSLLGIGGGIIHVPILVQLLNFPTHIATATSHFILAIMAGTGSLVHLFQGSLTEGIYQTIALSVGVLFGAPLGARFSKKIQGVWIIRSLAIALGLVGLRILLMIFK